MIYARRPRRQGPISMLIGLIANKIEEKKHPENKAFKEQGRAEVYGEQASGEMRSEERRVEERISGDWRTDDSGEEREEELQANGRMRVEDAMGGPPSYDETLRATSNSSSTSTGKA